MHQPRYNLTGPVYESETARDVFNQTLHPYTYPPNVLEKYEDARVTFNFTGSLIEQLNELMNADFDPRLKGLWDRYREAKKWEEPSSQVVATSTPYFHSYQKMIAENKLGCT